MPARRPAVTLHCAHFGRCGGCTRLDQPIAEQVAAKVAGVRALLEPFRPGLGIEHEVPAAPPRHYRARILYPVQPHPTLGLTMGIYARGSHEAVEIEECRIQDPALTELGRRALGVFRGLRLKPYDEAAHAGMLRAFHARIAPGTGEMLMGVVTLGGECPEGTELARALLAAAEDLPGGGADRPRAVGVVRNLNPERGNALLGERSVPLAGRDYLEDRSGGLHWRISFGSFTQANRHADRVLYARALDLLGPVRGLRVVDGYGGLGAFGLRLARAGAAAVRIVEEHPAACRDAEHNARRNGLPQVLVEERPFARAELGGGTDLLVVDPPRAGLQADGLRPILVEPPDRILYVACNPRSLARDLDPLHVAGYRLTRVRVVDLFPHTDHVEVLALLVRRSHLRRRRGPNL
ncbi:MAG: 23S rRNA (uracil(1939)-C(5))-methyltransferase RlmD [Planctomycetes bacterium]|nr:23S rRNA (uracil(1939)-C(5))-methyltransferase RlmD [Planctomycetota bacterium]